MKILILGLRKSGTTAMLNKVANGLPNCQAFSGGKPGKYIGNYENAVYKHTYEERKGKSVALYRDHKHIKHLFENQVRELDAKILLACVAARRGLQAIIGLKRDVESPSLHKLRVEPISNVLVRISP